MADNPKKTFSVKAVDTTEVPAYVAQKFGRAPIFKLVRATGLHASSKLTFYLCEAAFKTNFAADATSVATTYYVPVDVAAGHVVNGHTLTTADYVLLPGADGWALRAVASVVDDAGQDYCHFTVATTSGKAVVTENPLYIIRSTMVHDLTVGVATIEKTNWFACDVGVPIVVSATSGDATDTIATITVEFEDPA